ARRIRQGQIALIDERFGRGERDLSRNRQAVIIQRCLLQIVFHGAPVRLWRNGSHHSRKPPNGRPLLSCRLSSSSAAAPPRRTPGAAPAPATWRRAVRRRETR